MVDTKICSKCGETKRAEEFQSNRRQCSKCLCEYAREYLKKNKDKINKNRRKNYTNNKEKDRIRNREYSANNKEKIREYRRKYQQDNKEKIREYQRKYRQNNKDKLCEYRRENYENHKEYFRKHRENNKDKYRGYDQKRRSRKAALPSTLTIAEWQWLCEQTDQRCIYCGENPDILEREHVIPLTQDGGYTLENIRPACKSCNSIKGGRTPEQAGMKLIDKYESRIQTGLCWKQEELF